MSKDNNMPPSPVDHWEFTVIVPPFVIRKRVDKHAPEVLIQRGAELPRNPSLHGDMIITEMAKRIDQDGRVLGLIGKMLLGGGPERVYNAKEIVDALQVVLDNQPPGPGPDIQGEGGPGGVR